MFWGGIIVMTIIGIIMVVNPYWVYKILEGWKNVGGEGPSKAYIVEISFGGLMFMVVSIGCGVIRFLTNVYGFV